MATRETGLHPTPWHCEGAWIVDAADFPVGKLFTPEDAERVVAAVNACVGIPTQHLRDGIVRRSLDERANTLEEDGPGRGEIRKSP